MCVPVSPLVPEEPRTYGFGDVLHVIWDDLRSIREPVIEVLISPEGGIALPDPLYNRIARRPRILAGAEFLLGFRVISESQAGF